MVTRSDWSGALNSLLISKCLRCKLWEDSLFVCRQLERVGPVLANALVEAGLISFQKIQETNPRDIELVRLMCPQIHMLIFLFKVNLSF